MNFSEEIITIALVALSTMATRFLPFILLRGEKRSGGYMRYIGRALPAAVFAMLTVYCLRNISFSSAEAFLPQLISIATVVILHLTARRTLLSVGVGTGVYLILVNLVFV